MTSNRTVIYHWVDGRRLYCRRCTAVTPHNEYRPDPHYLACAHCGHLLLGAEVVSTYSDDKYDRTPRILLPLDLLAQRERDDIIRRVYNHAARLGVLGQYIPEDSDPWAGLDTLLAELAG